MANHLLRFIPLPSLPDEMTWVLVLLPSAAYLFCRLLWCGAHHGPSRVREMLKADDDVVRSMMKEGRVAHAAKQTGGNLAASGRPSRISRMISRPLPRGSSSRRCLGQVSPGEAASSSSWALAAPAAA